MTFRTPRVVLLLAAFLGLGVGAWFGWRCYTTPAPPRIRLDGVQKEIVEAVESALEEVRRHPRSGDAWGKLGMVLHANGFVEQGVECYLHAERFDPKNPRWPYLRGGLLFEGNRSQGILLFRQALARAERYEDRAAIHFRLGQLSIEDQQLDEADQHLQALREIEPSSPRVHFGLGLLAVARGDRTTARDRLRLLIELPYARRRACALLARVEDEGTQTAQKFRELAARFPKDEAWPDPFEDEVLLRKVDRLCRIAEFWDLKKQGRLQEAIDFLRTYIAERPDAEVCYILGCHLFERIELEEAEQMFRATLRCDPSNAKAHLFLGEILYHKAEKLWGEAGARERARELFREVVAAEDRALALEPTLGLAHLPRGRSLKRLGRADEAIRAFREALLRQPQTADVHLSLGETLAEMGQLSEALEHLENAVRFAGPNDPRPRDALEKWRAKAVQKK